MTTILTVGARLSALFFILVFYSTAFADSAKVDVCHIPPDDPESFHTIRINQTALSAHLAHGDFAGACNTDCAILCDDGNACTVDDTLDCEEQGCPTFPREPVHCSDGLACTDDSCDIVNGCENEPVECIPSDLCHVSMCAETDGECAETPVVCDTGEVCDLGTGDCVPDVTDGYCPCWEPDDLLSVTEENNDSLGSCSMSQAPFQVIRNTSPGSEVEGGFAALVDGFASACFTRDSNLELSITEADAQACAQQIINRCSAIGDPIDPAILSAASVSADNDIDLTTIFD